MANKKEDKRDEYLYKFLNADDIDNLIKKRVKAATPTNRKKGDGNNVIRWLPYELECRRQVIIDLIRQGLSQKRVQEEIMVRWEIGKTSAQTYIKDALEQLVENRDTYIAHNREIQMERMQGALEECIANKDYKNASKYQDMINKIGGLYTENINANVSGEISFEFGGEEEK